MADGADSRTFPVLVVAGTRPEAIKLVPLIQCLRDSDVFEPVVISTGQHELMVDEIMAMAGVVPDHHLEVGSHGPSLNARVANVIGRFGELCVEVFGDHGGQMPSAEELLSGR
jgi:UDP-N-acetylglucosamine 2-epimerase (non-hydrolysing)